MASITQIISAINPDKYYSLPDDKEKAKKELESFKQKKKEEGFQRAADKAKPKADAEHTLVYDSATEGLEPVYFFIVDLMKDFGLNPEKLVDNFSASPGSAHFSELSQKASIMQQNAASYLEKANTILRSVLNQLYDLREMKQRLTQYDNLYSKEKETREAARQALKQIWMDKVDAQKGNGSIHMMSQKLNFTTLRNAFLAATDQKSAEKLDLNDVVKRLVKARISEFNAWVKESERELRKRYNTTRNYLKSQVSSLRLYSRWARPYLKAAQQLEMKDQSREPALVKTFDTLILELALLGKSKLKVEDLAKEGEFPKEFGTKKFLKKMDRNYYSCVLVDFNFRSFPKQTGRQQHYSFGGKVEVTFRGYSLNDDELKKLNEELERSDFEEVFENVKGATEESLDKIYEEINYYINEEDEEKKEENKEKKSDQSNPFVALFGGYNSSESKKASKKKEENRKENWYEKEYLRPKAQEGAKETAFSLFDKYKKAHGMNSFT